MAYPAGIQNPYQVSFICESRSIQTQFKVQSLKKKTSKSIKRDQSVLTLKEYPNIMSLASLKILKDKFSAKKKYRANQ